MTKRNQLVALGFVAITLLFYSCGGDGQKNEELVKPSKEELRASIKVMEDSLKKLQVNQIPVENLHQMELINRLKLYYELYSEDKYSPVCLDNIHMIYSGMGVPELSSAYADTLLDKYPTYENRAMILESQGSNYDVFITPRDSAMVRYYYSLLLKENPNLNKDKRKGIIDRLAHNNLTFDEYLSKKIKDMAIK
jgi:hypothetical protein